MYKFLLLFMKWVIMYMRNIQSYLSFVNFCKCVDLFHIVLDGLVKIVKPFHIILTGNVGTTTK